MLRRMMNLIVLHSVVVAFCLTGCGANDVPKKQQASPSHVEKPGEHHEGDGHKHDHPTEGPHKGHLIELGKEEFHAELTHDETTKTVMIYLLDGKAQKAVSIAATELTLNLVVDGKPRQVKLSAIPQADDSAGESSAFAVKDEAVLEALEAPKTTCRLNVSIGGKSYVGAVEHHEHDDHK